MKIPDWFYWTAFVACALTVLVLFSGAVPFSLIGESPSSSVYSEEGSSSTTVYSVVGCTPEQGYSGCYVSEYSYGSAKAEAELQYSSIYDANGDTGKYLVDAAYINVECGGDGDLHELYVYYGDFGSWNSFWNDEHCDEDGCDGDMIFSGAHELDTSGTAVNLPIFVCWSKDTFGSDWAWAATGWGWVDTDESSYYKIVECNENADCDSNGYCDSHVCYEKECETGEVECNGKSYFECEDYEWVDKGMVAGKCGVECLTNSDCEGTTYGSKYCYDGNVYRDKSYETCANYVCKAVTPEKELVQTCEYGCEDGVCLDEPEYDYLTYAAIGIAVIAVIVGIWWWRK